jgi:superfamily II DNA or RNA helicase
MKLRRDDQIAGWIFDCAQTEREVASSNGFQAYYANVNGVRQFRFWYTTNARVALKLAGYCDDDQERERILRLAALEPDPDKATLVWDGEMYRYYTPVTNFWAYNGPPKQSSFRFAKDPKRSFWWSQDEELAARCYRAAMSDAKVRDVFIITDELREKLTARFEQRASAVAASRALDADIEIPCKPGLAFKGFQKAGVKLACEYFKKNGVLLGDDTGVGKTIQAIGVINYKAEEIKRVCVVCPATIKDNWKREIDTWLTAPLTSGIANSVKFPRTDIVIVNYEQLSKVYDGERQLRGGLAKVAWDLVIVDEAHRIKNPKTQRAKFTFSIPARRSLYLTGTPLPNRTLELWPLLHHLAPEVFGKQINEWYFKKRYCGATKKVFWKKEHGKPVRKEVWDFSGSSNLEELQEIMRSTLMIRRMKKDVLPELGRKMRQVIELSVEGSAADAALAAERAKWDQDAHDRLAARAELAKASDDDRAYERAVRALEVSEAASFEETSRERHETALAKLPAVLDRLEDVLEEQTKVIVFAWHHDVMDALMEKFGQRAVKIAGDVPAHLRQGLVDRFNEDPSVNLAVCQIVAAGVGLNMQAAPFVAFVEESWVPGDVTQCEDRAWRMGQKADCVVVQHWVVPGSIDAQMIRTTVDKQEVADRALDNETPIEKLAREALALPTATETPLVLPEKTDAPPETIVVPAPGSRKMPLGKEARRDWIAAEATRLSQAEIDMIHTGLRTLAGVCDGARSLDGSGFNGVDAHIGRDLAERPSLTPKQAALGKMVLWKYRHTQLQGSFDDIWAANETEVTTA